MYCCLHFCKYHIYVKMEMIFMPFYIIILFGIPTVIKTIKLKHEMTPEVKRIHEVFIRIENSLHRKNK